MFVADSLLCRINFRRNPAKELFGNENRRTFASDLRFTHKLVRVNFLFHIAFVLGLVIKKQLALAGMRALAACMKISVL